MLALLLASVVSAGPIALDTANVVSFDNCSSSGSSAQTITSGRSYLMTVKGEDTWVCIADSASTCSSGGSVFPSGTVMLVAFGGTSKSVSCRSAASGGDLQFTPVN